MERDCIDFKNMNVGKLFVKQLIPTILGTVASTLFIVCDGIFVGHGIGSDALAAINISAPILTIITGIGLMFGMGGGILVSINLSRGKKKVANMNVTQSLVASLVTSIIFSVVFCLFARPIGFLLGSDTYLIEQVVEYFFWYSMSIPFSVTIVVLPFFSRLTNPNISMWALLAAAATNILLDYFFIFVFRWGLFGAAIATGISELIGALIVFSHLCHHTSTVHLVRVKLSIRSLKLTLRNIGYMIRLGVSASLNEIAISIMIVTGNLAFMHSLGPNGVAAFSIICYLFPIVFLIFSAIVQSVQPIVSYNYGGNLLSRSNEAVRWALGSAITFAIVVMCIFIFYSSNVVGLFIPDPSNPARLYATEGLSLFSLDFIFFAINIVAIGYYASIEWLARATTLTIIRGILPVVFFYFLPLWIGISGIWLAVALSDALITIVILFLFFAQKYKHKRRDS